MASPKPGRRQATLDRRFAADQTRGHSLQNTDWTDAFRIRKDERGADVQNSAIKVAHAIAGKACDLSVGRCGSRCTHARTLG